MRLPLTLITALAAVLLSHGQAVNIQSITPVVNLTVPSSAFNLATGAASITSNSAISTTLKANKDWNFSVRTTGANFTHTPASGAPSTTKPVSGLLIRGNGSSSFIALSTSSVVIATGAKGPSIDRNFDLRFDTTLNDSPGQYSVVLVFTLVTL
jgi:hypothetical protein